MQVATPSQSRTVDQISVLVVVADVKIYDNLRDDSQGSFTSDAVRLLAVRGKNDTIRYDSLYLRALKS